MLGGLALKRRWKRRREAESKTADKPNLVMGINVQVCWEKFANYWDVEMRLVPMEGDRFNLSPEEAVKLCDENTIEVVGILGSTFDGSYEPIAELCERLGFDGYWRVQGYARDGATRLADRIAELGPFELLTRGDELPVFAFRLKDDVDNYTVFDVSNAMRERGWQLPAYTFPENRTDLAALRVVVRRGFTHDLADLLVEDLQRQLPRLQSQAAPVHDASTGTAFAH